MRAANARTIPNPPQPGLRDQLSAHNAPAIRLRSIALDALAEEIRRIEGGFGNARLRRHIPTGIAPLDERLPGGGVAAAALHEFIAVAEGCGLRTWALWLARQAMTNGGYVLWLDSAGDFYPPAAWAWGIDSQRLVLVRPRDRKDVYWVMDQALRCRGMAAVVGSPGRLTKAEARRLQLAAEAGGGVGILIAISNQRSAVSQASIGVASRWRIAPASQTEKPHAETQSQQFTVEVLRCRGGHAVAPIVLEVSRESGLVAVSTRLADRSRAPATELAADRKPRLVRSA